MATQVSGELYASITGQLFEIGRQLRQPNGYPFDPRQLQLMLQAGIEGHFGSQKPIGDTLPISVDYSLSLADMIKAGKYDGKNDDIIAERFPLKGTGIVERDLRLWHFDREIETPEVERIIRAAGEEPSPIEDLLAFGAKYPDEQRKYPIIALGSSAQVYGSRHVAYLDRYGTLRHLFLYYYDRRWHRCCRFLSRKVSVA